MRNATNGPLYIGAVLGALVLAAIAWALGVSPRLDRQAEANAAREDQIARNADLQQQLADLKVASENLPELIEQIYEIRDDLPPEEAIPEWRRTVDQILADAGLVALEDSVSQPIEIRPVVSIAEQTRAVGIKSPIEGIQFSRLFATPFDLQFAGPPDKVFRVIDELQYGDHRYYLITGLSLVGTSEPSDNAGVELQPGDITVDMTGLIFTLDYGRDDIQVRPVAPIGECLAIEDLPDNVQEALEELANPDPNAVDDEPGFSFSSGTFDIDGVQYSYSSVNGGDYVFMTEDGTEIPLCGDGTEERPEDYNPFVPLD